MYEKLEKITLGLLLFAMGVVVWCSALFIYEEYRLNKACTETVEATIVDREDLLCTDSNGNEYTDFSAMIIYEFGGNEYDSIVVHDKLKELSAGDTISIRVNPDRATELLVN